MHTCRSADGRDLLTIPVAYTDLLCRHHPVGSPALCVDRVRTSAARTGIDHVIMMVEGPGSRERILENIARLATDVLPHL